MGFVTTADGTEIYYKDWGDGRPVVLSHGWPLNSRQLGGAAAVPRRRTATGSSPTTAAVTAGPARPGTATTWTTTPTTWPPS